MWFILLFTLAALAIPIALEIHVKGSDNIVNRAGKEILASPIGQRLRRVPGATKAWASALLALILLLVLGLLALRLLGWLLSLLFS